MFHYIPLWHSVTFCHTLWPSVTFHVTVCDILSHSRTFQGVPGYSIIFHHVLQCSICDTIMCDFPYFSVMISDTLSLCYTLVVSSGWNVWSWRFIWSGWCVWSDGESVVADDQVDLLSRYGNVGVVWVGPDHTSVFRRFLLTVHMVWPLGMNIVLR